MNDSKQGGLRAAVVAALLLVAPACAARAQEGVPQVTREWLRQTFLEVLDLEPDSVRAEEGRLWRAVRHRPQTRELLIEIYEDERESGLARSNALLHLGATGQREA